MADVTENTDQQVTENGTKGKSFTNPAHQANLSYELADKRNEGILTDINLCSGDTTYTCHMIILYLGSSYFQRKSEEEIRPDTIVLDHIKPEVLGSMIDYMYTGNIMITDDMLKMYAQASYILGLKELKEACDSMIKDHVVTENCLSMCTFASTNDLPRTKQSALDLMLSIPDTIMEKAAESEFYSLGFDDLIDWISSNIIRVKDESSVFRLALRWMNADLEYRRPKAQQVFTHLRLAYCDPDFIEEKISKHPLFKELKAGQMMLEEARQCMNDPELREKMTWTNPTPREVQTIVLMGGGGGSEENKNTECYYLKADDSWETLTTLPEALAKYPYDLVACVAGGTKIVVSGGSNDKNISPGLSDAVWMFDIPTREWRDLPSMTTERFSHSMVYCQGSVFVFGGYTERKLVLASAEKLDSLESDEWVEIAEMPKIVEGSFATVFDQQIYLASAYHKRVQCYDPLKDEWTFITTQVPLYSSPGYRGLVAGDDIYLVGGSKKQFFVYHTKEETWEDLTLYDNTCERPGFAMEWQGKVLLGGGYDNDKGSDEIEEYDTGNGTWSPSALKLPVKGSGFCSLKTFV